MARYQVILAYDGTGFAGSQRQALKKTGKYGDPPRTVQGELEKALRRLGWKATSVLMAGRTDAGVHASGQVAAFDLEWQHGSEDLVRALNALLPPDMAVQQAKSVPPHFHPRFDATSRRYRYRLFCHPLRQPLRERYAWRIWPDVEGEMLAQVAALLVGTHDFAAFGSPPHPASSTVRTVTKAEWQRSGDEWQFEIQAEAFLYRMVRRLVFVQVAVAQGKASAETVAQALAAPAQSLARSALPAGLAPAHGLTLVEVTYQDIW
jgi:tRNA pseudouridine38-40 synthase